MSREIESPKTEGWYMLTVAGWAGPYHNPSDAQPRITPPVYWRKCSDCSALHSSPYQPCEACGLEYRAAVNGSTHASDLILGEDGYALEPEGPFVPSPDPHFREE